MNTISSVPRIAFVWSQFAAYHIDRCEAVAHAMGDRARIYAVEIATTSDTYAWEASGGVQGCEKITLFPGGNAERLGMFVLIRRLFGSLRGMDMVCVGIPYSQPAMFFTAILLRLFGVRMVMMNDSKFDDFPRRLLFEMIKRLAMAPFQAAIVAGTRHEAYLRFLGFGRRPILHGYDTVSVARIRRQMDFDATAAIAGHADRPFVFVGRFVPKKGLDFLIDAYLRYRALASDDARRLILVGSGPLEAEIRQTIAAAGMDDAIIFPGFLPAPEVARILGTSLALILPSREEQWGLVVNEALAAGLPVIVSENVGARDTLVRNLINGFVVEQGAVDGLAQAMLALSTSPDEWSRMAASSIAFAEQGDARHFATAVEMLSTRLLRN